ncbi:ABC transporter permease [uncultured Alistipes sp.]|uniref:ABC transporter permease n=1 Tax=uncultured Alistipes sp. TaxID=538949 RepID=UPI002632C7D9|nr:ABC transporter permease [uncultured Alistipes sp.]
MNRFIRQMRSYGEQLRSVAANEVRMIFGDSGVVLVVVLALLIYATVYSLAYGSEVLREVPIGVVDKSRTPSSRALVETFNAGPNTYVAYNPADMQEARQLFFDRDIYGIVYIPADYERKLLGGEQADVALYVDAGYFLMYRQVFQEIVTSIGKTGAMVEFQRLVAKGANIPQAKAISQPVVYRAHNLFNPYLGYGTFVMPAIILVIIQQTMLIGIGMVGGTWREKRLYGKLRPAGRRRMSTLPIVAGRGAVYAAIYAATCTYILAVHYRLFGYPMNGHTSAVLLFMGLYMAASIALALAVSTLFRHRENSLLLLLWTSVPVLLLSGVSYPREGMPEWLYSLGQLLPSSHGIRGFIRIRSMGASLAEVADELRMLGILALVYGFLACVGIHRAISREAQEEAADTPAENR